MFLVGETDITTTMTVYQKNIKCYFESHAQYT